MADRCAGCLNKFRRFEKPTLCPSCHRNFCSSCLPASKKEKKKGSHPPVRQTCVYCTREQKRVIRDEEAEVMETFQERFYQHKHSEPPIQTRVQLDPSKMEGGGGRAEPKLTEEDKRLEERLRALKEGGKEAAPQCSEDELRAKLAKLRGEGGEQGDLVPSRPAGQPPQGQGKTQFEETQDLFKKATEEVRLDEKLAETNRKRDDNLSNRLQVLKGRDPSTAASSGGQQSDVDIQQFLEGMEIEIIEESPEQLLQDLKEAEVKQARELVAGQLGSDRTDSKQTSTPDDLNITPYPNLPPELGAEDSEPVSESEVAKLVECAAAELKADRDAEQRDKAFIESASEQLAKLREDGEEEESDCVVRSKPSGARDSRSDSHLSFKWEHFGPFESESTMDPNTLATRQLGITLSMDEDDRVSDDAVAALVDQMMEEVSLDRKLEAGGYGSYLEEQSNQPDTGASHDPGPQLKPQGGAGGASLAAAYEGDDDLPWCCICNEDASIRCYDCDGDLYCSRCFSEGHESFGLFDHRYVAYEPPSKSENQL